MGGDGALSQPINEEGLAEMDGVTEVTATPPVFETVSDTVFFCPLQTMDGARRNETSLPAG
jgi:hypothetical protein